MSAAANDVDAAPERATPDPYWERFATALAQLMADQSFEPPAVPPAGYSPPDVDVTDEVAAADQGDVPVRVYRPRGSSDLLRPALVWCHGGAWFSGDLDMPEADATAREVCARADAVVVSVGYRLALHGVHFPAPHQDVVGAYLWTVAKASRLGVDRTRISLGGASAGGNLAAGAGLRVRDDRGPLPRSLVLVYPALHPITPPPSPEHAAAMAAAATPPVSLAPEVVQVVTENYLGAPLDQATPYAFPALGALTGLPETLVVTCEVDPLRSSGEHFTCALRKEGVQVTDVMARGVDHGHINQPWLAQAQATYADLAAWVAGRT